MLLLANLVARTTFPYNVDERKSFRKVHQQFSSSFLFYNSVWSLVYLVRPLNTVIFLFSGMHRQLLKVHSKPSSLVLDCESLGSLA